VTKMPLMHAQSVKLANLSLQLLQAGAYTKGVECDNFGGHTTPKSARSEARDRFLNFGASIISLKWVKLGILNSVTVRVHLVDEWTSRTTGQMVLQVRSLLLHRLKLSSYVELPRSKTHTVVGRQSGWELTR